MQIHVVCNQLKRIWVPQKRELKRHDIESGSAAFPVRRVHVLLRNLEMLIYLCRALPGRDCRTGIARNTEMVNAASEKTKQKQSLVVVIDDDYDVLEWCRVILEFDGFTVACFYDIEKAYAFMQSHHPDIILSDLMMAELNSGFDFARRIKQTPGLAHVPIIILTAASSRHGFDFSPKNDTDLKAMHVDAFFSKPVDQAVLLSKIHELIAKTSSFIDTGSV